MPSPDAATANGPSRVFVRQCTGTVRRGSPRRPENAAPADFCLPRDHNRTALPTLCQFGVKKMPAKCRKTPRAAAAETRPRCVVGHWATRDKRQPAARRESHRTPFPLPEGAVVSAEDQRPGGPFRRAAVWQRRTSGPARERMTGCSATRSANRTTRQRKAIAPFGGWPPAQCNRSDPFSSQGIR